MNLHKFTPNPNDQAELKAQIDALTDAAFIKERAYNEACFLTDEQCFFYAKENPDSIYNITEEELIAIEKQYRHVLIIELSTRNGIFLNILRYITACPGNPDTPDIEQAVDKVIKQIRKDSIRYSGWQDEITVNVAVYDKNKLVAGLHYNYL